MSEVLQVLDSDESVMPEYMHTNITWVVGRRDVTFCLRIAQWDIAKIAKSLDRDRDR
jgi:hypothetical protein